MTYKASVHEHHVQNPRVSLSQSSRYHEGYARQQSVSRGRGGTAAGRPTTETMEIRIACLSLPGTTRGTPDSSRLVGEGEELLSGALPLKQGNGGPRSSRPGSDDGNIEVNVSRW